jgi:hypothetical protein
MTAAPPPLPPPGWYPDPSGTPGQRYFDGTNWTEHRAATFAPKQQSTAGRAALIIVAAVVLLFGGCVALVAISSNNAPDNSTSTSATGAGAGDAGLNQPVRDGKLEFVVSGVRRQPRFGGQRARGEYVVVSMTVSNTGNEQQTFFSNNQKLIDTAGRKFDADTTASNMYWMQEMNPGFSVNVEVPFDVPPGTPLSAIELHDSAFSGGATVNLR